MIECSGGSSQFLCSDSTICCSNIQLHEKQRNVTDFQNWTAAYGIWRYGEGIFLTKAELTLRLT